MALVIHYSEKSVLRMVPYFIKQKEAAIAFDALNTLLVHLEETLSRLTDALVSASLREESPKIDSIALITSGIWNVLDTIHRIFLLYPLLYIGIGPKTEALRISIKGFRDSYQHLDERIADHFQERQVGDSVFGDYQWRYRAALGEPANAYLCVSGITLGNSNLRKPDQKSFNDKYDETGVFDLEIFYIERTLVDKKARQFSHYPITLRIDEIIENINGLITMLEEGYDWIKTEALSAAAAGSKLQGTGLSPFIMTFYPA